MERTEWRGECEQLPTEYTKKGKAFSAGFFADQTHGADRIDEPAINVNHPPRRLSGFDAPRRVLHPAALEPS